MNQENTHYAKTKVAEDTYQVFFNEELILESNQAVELEEHYAGKDFPAVIYFPESALTELEISKAEKSTHCPIKGDASYWSYQEAANSIWCYQEPYSQVDQIRNHYAFDQSQGFRIAVAA